jgi:hypothetical protein
MLLVTHSEVLEAQPEHLASPQMPWTMQLVS